MMLILFFISLCNAYTPYLLRFYPSNSMIVSSSFTNGPCIQPIKTLAFLQDTDDTSLDHTECFFNSNESVLICKLGLKDPGSSIDLEKYPVNQIHVVILFVQEFSEKVFRNRVLNLCFLNRFGSSLQELAICGYKNRVISNTLTHSYLHILDIPTLAIVVSKIETLLISSTVLIKLDKSIFE